MWVGGASAQKSAAAKKEAIPRKGSGRRLKSPNASTGRLSRKSTGFSEDGEGGDSGSDNDLDASDVLVGTNDGADIDFDLLMAGTAPSSEQPKARPGLKIVTGDSLAASATTNLDLAALDLDRLDRNFNKHLLRSSAVDVDNNQLSLKQLVSSLLVSLVTAQDASGVAEQQQQKEQPQFAFQSEECFSFVVDS